jgi:hypothetical protein
MTGASAATLDFENTKNTLMGGGERKSFGPNDCETAIPVLSA